MHLIRSVLRRAVVELPIQVENEEVRDQAIDKFLGELQLLFTPRLIGTLPDQVLTEMFEDWVNALPHLNVEQRTAALIADVRLCRIPYLIYRNGYAAAVDERDQDLPPAGNVVPLHRR